MVVVPQPTIRYGRLGCVGGYNLARAPAAAKHHTQVERGTQSEAIEALTALLTIEVKSQPFPARAEDHI